MDAIEERIVLAQLFTRFLHGIKELDDYIKRTSRHFNVPLNITDVKHSLLLWQERLEINKEISEKRNSLAEIVSEGNDLISRGHPESANVQEYMDSKEADLKNLELACEAQLEQLEVSIISLLEKKHSRRKIEGDNSKSRTEDGQIPIPVKDIQTSELAVRLREAFEKSWENYQQRSAVLEIEKFFLQPLRLHTAVLCGAYDEVERLCKITEEIEQRDFLGRSALHVAISCTVTTQEQADVATNIFNLLLKAGCDPWKKDGLTGLDSFEYAARIKAYSALNLLLSEIGEERSNIMVDFEELVAASVAGDHVNVLKCCSADAIIKKNASGKLILEMCERGSVNVLKHVIENFDVFDHLNQVDEYQNTLLHKACAHRHFDVLELLLRSGLQVDAANVIGKTALHVASEVRAIECIELLLKHGSDVLAKDYEGRSPLYLGRHHADVLDLLTASSCNLQLHLAVHSGNVEYVRKLIEAGHDVNSLGVENESVLHIAAELGNDEMLELLAGSVSDLNVRNNTGLTALHLALRKGYVRCAEILINKGADVECDDEMHNTPLHLAARYGHDSILKLLLTKGAKVYRTNINDQSALHFACQCANFACVEALLQNGAYANSRDKWGNHPVYLAAAKGDGKLLNLLCERGADVNVENLKKRTALHRASEQGNLAWVRGLLKRQADVYSQDEDTYTPLVLAAKNGHHDVVKLLVKKKTLKSVASNEYEITMRFACENSHLECVKLLESNGVKCDEVDQSVMFYLAASKGHKEVVTYLISKGWNINKCGVEKKNALHFAVAFSHRRCAQILIENGADINTVDDRGAKPFHVAAAFGKCDIMTLLLSNGVHVNCADDINRNALHYAAMAPHSGQTVHFLIENGASINLQDVDGHTPMHLAFYTGNKEVIDILKQQGARMDIRSRKALRPCEMPLRRNMIASNEFMQRLFIGQLFRNINFIL